MCGSSVCAECVEKEIRERARFVEKKYPCKGVEDLMVASWFGIMEGKLCINIMVASWNLSKAKCAMRSAKNVFVYLFLMYRYACTYICRVCEQAIHILSLQHGCNRLPKLLNTKKLFETHTYCRHASIVSHTRI
jgi:hypothetical protein